MLLGSFVLSNLISLCLATDLKLGGRFFVITLFMIVSWLTFVGLLGAFQERGLCTLMSGYAFGGAAMALLAVLAYVGVLPFGEVFLYYNRIKGLFKDPNVFGPHLALASVYATHRLLAQGACLGRRYSGCWPASAHRSACCSASRARRGQTHA